MAWQFSGIRKDEKKIKNSENSKRENVKKFWKREAMINCSHKYKQGNPTLKLVL